MLHKSRSCLNCDALQILIDGFANEIGNEMLNFFEIPKISSQSLLS